MFATDLIFIVWFLTWNYVKRSKNHLQFKYWLTCYHYDQDTIKITVSSLTVCDVGWHDDYWNWQTPELTYFLTFITRCSDWRVCDQGLSDVIPSNVLWCELVLYSSNKYESVMFTFYVFFCKQIANCSCWHIYTSLYDTKHSFNCFYRNIRLLCTHIFFWKALNFIFRINEQLWMLLWNISGEELAL